MISQWFTRTTKSHAAIRQEVGLFTGESPESGVIGRMKSPVRLTSLLASRHVKGELTHQLVRTAKPATA